MTTSELGLPRSVNQTWRPVAAVLVGTGLGWFDLAIYGFFVVTMAKLFFPVGNEAASVLLALATFGATFITRPFGAVVLGRFAANHGRKPALALSLALSLAATALVAFAPPYASVGLASPVLVVASRLIQGFAVGGEFGSAAAFLVEQHPDRQGLYASWQFSTQVLAAVLATAFGLVLTSALTDQQMTMWGWRVPFLAALLLGPVAYYLRTRVPETRAFRSVSSPSLAAPREPAKTSQRVLVCLGIVMFGTVLNYTILYMPSYAVLQMNLPAPSAFAASFAATLLQMILIPLAGMLSDRYGRLPIAIPAAIVGLVIALPSFLFLAAVPTLTTLVVAEVMLGTVAAAYGGAIAALMAELFTTRMRTTGVAVSYSLGVAVFGGFAPFIDAGLIETTGTKAAPSYYLILAACVSLVALAAAGPLARKSR